MSREVNVWVALGFWSFWFLLILVFWVGVIWTAVHFIHKYW